MTIDPAELANQTSVPIADVTDRVGEALSEIGESVHRLQSLIAPLILEAAARNPVHLRELQDFDHISQKLKNLGDFLGALALALPDHWRLDPSVAAKVLTLAELEARLALAEKSEGETHAPGDFELFN
ncbi:MAG: hypothetical protein P4L68_00455 [Methylovirgula sp.]|nr:hypothetical protein [Methylovirgula sp.]